MKSFHEDCLTLPKEVRRKPLTTCVNNGSPNLEIANFISTRTHYYQCAHQIVYVRESNAFLRHITTAWDIVRLQFIRGRCLAIPKIRGHVKIQVLRLFGA